METPSWYPPQGHQEDFQTDPLIHPGFLEITPHKILQIVNVTPTQLQQNLWIFRLQIVLKFTTYFIYNHVFKMGVNYSWLLHSILTPPCKSFDLLSMTPQLVLPAKSCKHLEMQAYACHGTKTLSRQKLENKIVTPHML